MYCLCDHREVAEYKRRSTAPPSIPCSAKVSTGRVAAIPDCRRRCCSSRAPSLRPCAHHTPGGGSCYPAVCCRQTGISLFSSIFFETSWPNTFQNFPLPLCSSWRHQDRSTPGEERSRTALKGQPDRLTAPAFGLFEENCPFFSM